MAVGLAVVVVVATIGTAATLTLTRHTTPVSASPTKDRGLQISGVTVTAAPQGKESAVVMTLHNASGGPISLLNVSSSLAGMNMLYYDANMCQGNSLMTWLPNVLISRGYTQHLGYKNQGVMLSLLHQSLKVGQVVTLRVNYSDFSTSRSTTVRARVVAAPKGLHFAMSSMRM